MTTLPVDGKIKVMFQSPPTSIAIPTWSHFAGKKQQAHPIIPLPQWPPQQLLHATLRSDQWNALRENLHRKPSIFPWNMDFSCRFSLNESNDGNRGRDFFYIIVLRNLGISMGYFIHHCKIYLSYDVSSYIWWIVKCIQVSFWTYIQLHMMMCSFKPPCLITPDHNF